MVIYGLTGGVGMGKSTVAGMLAGKGIPVVDTDDIAREVVEPGAEALREIQCRFGDGLLFRDGSLNRRKMAELVFADPSARKVLEQILHPRIRNEWQKRVHEERIKGEPCVIVVIPLLFETGGEGLVDRTVCVACSLKSQSERLKQRGWDDNQVVGRVNAQWPIGQKMDRADYVIWNEGPLWLTEKQLVRVFGRP